MSDDHNAETEIDDAEVLKLATLSREHVRRVREENERARGAAKIARPHCQAPAADRKPATLASLDGASIRANFNPKRVSADNADNADAEGKPEPITDANEIDDKAIRANWNPPQHNAALDAEFRRAVKAAGD